LCNTVQYQHAQTNNLLNTKGWKQFKKNTEPTPTNHTNFCLTKRTVNCFEQALHAHQINKANHPETGKLCEYPALLQSFDGHHWQESTCEEIGRLAQGYPLWCLREPTLFFS